MAETMFRAPSGVHYTLQRPHTSASSSLRAWSAADALALTQLKAWQDEGQPLGRVLIVNDEFGALACGSGAASPVVWTDSALSRAAIDANRSGNDLAPVEHVRGDEVPPGVFDTVAIRIPKTTALLEYQLTALRACLTPTTRVLGAGMARHIHRSTLSVFETIGPTTTSRATQKARLIHTNVADQIAPQPQAALEASIFETPSGIRIAELPGTFSEGHLDAGSAVLLEHLDALSELGDHATVVDLGCGTGVLAATAAQRWPQATYLLADVSDLAIAAARQTWTLNGISSTARFESSDGLPQTPSESVDVVLSNPPFHQGHALDPGLTDHLMAETARVLRPGGQALIVSQRQQKLHTRLSRWFTTVTTVSKHPSFVVLLAE